MAQSPISVIAGTIPTFAYESITVDNTVKSLSSVYTDDDGNVAVRAVITVDPGAQLRWRMDGGNPSSTEGHLANPTDSIILNNSSDIKNFKATRVGSTSAVIKVSYAG